MLTSAARVSMLDGYMLICSMQLAGDTIRVVHDPYGNLARHSAAVVSYGFHSELDDYAILKPARRELKPAELIGSPDWAVLLASTTTPVVAYAPDADDVHIELAPAGHNLIALTALKQNEISVAAGVAGNSAREAERLLSAGTIATPDSADDDSRLLAAMEGAHQLAQANQQHIGTQIATVFDAHIEVGLRYTRAAWLNLHGWFYPACFRVSAIEDVWLGDDLVEGSVHAFFEQPHSGDTFSFKIRWTVDEDEPFSLNSRWADVIVRLAAVSESATRVTVSQGALLLPQQLAPTRSYWNYRLADLAEIASLQRV